MPDCVGIDQSMPASAACLSVATTQIGQAPVFWGRYFKGPGNPDPAQYQAGQESSFLKSNNIKVLPIARQTPNVSSTDQNLGKSDGQQNAAAIIASFGASALASLPEVAVFLDAEIDNSLNHNYYLGWSAGLIQGGAPNVKFIPCLYAHHNDKTTWAEVGKAMDQGAICGAAWIVFMDLGTFPIGPWQAKFTSATMPPTLPVVMVQRILDFVDSHHRTYDFDLVNPDHQDWLLQRLVIPS
jgi:hypothetical protein